MGKFQGKALQVKSLLFAQISGIKDKLKMHLNQHNYSDMMEQDLQQGAAFPIFYLVSTNLESTLGQLQEFLCQQ